MKLIGNLKHLDRMAIDTLGIPGILLMETAGRLVAHQVQALCPNLTETIVILCGTGNNGGDGFVCARHLAMAGYTNLTVSYLSPIPSHGDAFTHFKLLAHYPVQTLEIPAEGPIPQPIKTLLTQATVVVDALFGSGLSRPIEGIPAQLIDSLNHSLHRANQLVVAIDLPSGINGETGAIQGLAIKADLTVTLVTGKPGLYLSSGKHQAGHVICVDIGLPQRLIDEDSSPIRLITPEFVAHSLPHSPADAHKYAVGSVLIIAGSQTMPGAAQLCAEAAMVSGAGLVYLAAPASVFSQLKIMPEIIHHPLPETETGQLGSEAFAALTTLLQQKTFQAMGIGPGLGQSEDTQPFLKDVISHCTSHQLPVILDADGLNLLAQLNTSLVLPPETILTPHPGEWTRLMDADKTQAEENLVQAAQDCQKRYHAQVVLKSASTVVACTDNTQWINPTGNVGMATAGSGDVLTGLTTSLRAQGCTSQQAAIGGAYLHGLAGDLAAKQFGQQAMTASHIIQCLPLALHQGIPSSPLKPQKVFCHG